MKQQTANRIERISQELATTPAGSGLSLKGVLERLPNWALVPLTVVIFGLLITDSAIADPLPFVDEAALFYALVGSMRVLGGRRKARKTSRSQEALEDSEIVVEVERRRAPPGQPAACSAV